MEALFFSEQSHSMMEAQATAKNAQRTKKVFMLKKYDTLTRFQSIHQPL
jgi:hypothetical protein